MSPPSGAALIERLNSPDGGVGLSLARGAATVASWGYGTGVGLRNAMFSIGIRQVHRLPRPTISVGNLTTGGTGKTPMVIEIVRRLRAMDCKPAVLLRGYGAATSSSKGDSTNRSGAAESGALGADEAAELAASLGVATPVIANPNRVAGAAEALARDPSVGAFVLDDGFQHRQAGRDLDLVLIDATRPFGFEHMLPRGFLREPVASLRRADGVIITRSDMVTAEALGAIEQRIEKLTGRPALAHAAHRWAELLDAGDRPVPMGALSGQAVASVAGLGNPCAFHEAVGRHAGRVVLTQTFPDHHDYTIDNVNVVIAAARRAGAAVLVLSEKDWVKWRAWWVKVGPASGLVLLRPRLVMRLTRGEEAVEERLRALIRR